MKLTEEILQERLQVNNILHSGAIIDLISNVVRRGSKELLIVLAEQNGVEMLMDNEDRVDVLDFFIDLATVLVNSYDERLGVMSALVYLLCERDRFSIDIQWTWPSVRRFEKFILWLEPLLSYPRARTLLAYVLNNFPPLRVTPRMIEAIIKTTPSILREIGQLGVAPNFTADLAVGADIIASICYFGLGLEIRELMKTDLIIYDSYYPKLRDMRCSHYHCELVRMTKKAIKERDEMPIVENSGPAKEMIASMGKGDLLRSAIGVDKLIKCFTVREEDKDSGDWTIDMDDILLNFFTIYHLWEISDLNPEFEALVGCIGPLHEVIVKAHFVERYLNLSTQGGRGGLPRGLGLWSVYYWRGSEIELVVNSSSVAWLQVMCERVVAATGANVIPLDDGFLLPFVACLYSAYTTSLQVRPELNECEDKTYLCADEFVCTWSTELSALVAKALGAIVGSVVADMLSSMKPVPQDKISRHLLIMSCCLGIVCGVGEYGKIPELRRPVIHPAGAACGMLTDVCRSFLKIVTEQSSCSMIRRIAQISLMRAEQSSGLRVVLA